MGTFTKSALSLLVLATIAAGGVYIYFKTDLINASNATKTEISDGSLNDEITADDSSPGDVLALSDEATYDALASGEYDTAIAKAEAALEYAQANFDSTSTEVRTANQNLALLYDAVGETGKSLNLLEANLAAYEVLDQVDTDALLAMRDTLAAAYDKNGQSDAAIAVYTQNEMDYAESFGADHEMVRGTRFKKALSLEKMGDVDGAAAILPTLYDLEAGPLDTLALSAANVMASLYESSGQIDEAIAVYERIQILDTAASDDVSADNLNIDYASHLERLQTIKEVMEAAPEYEFTAPEDAEPSAAN